MTSKQCRCASGCCRGWGGEPKSELVLSCRVFWEMFVFGHNNRKDEIYIKARAVCIASSKLCKG